MIAFAFSDDGWAEICRTLPNAENGREGLRMELEYWANSDSLRFAYLDQDEHVELRAGGGFVEVAETCKKLIAQLADMPPLSIYGVTDEELLFRWLDSIHEQCLVHAQMIADTTTAHSNAEKPVRKFAVRRVLNIYCREMNVTLPAGGGSPTGPHARFLRFVFAALVQAGKIRPEDGIPSGKSARDVIRQYVAGQL